MTFPWKRRRVKPEFSAAQKAQHGALADAVRKMREEKAAGIERCLLCRSIADTDDRALCGKCASTVDAARTQP